MAAPALAPTTAAPERTVTVPVDSPDAARRRVRQTDRETRDFPWWIRAEAVQSILAYIVVPFGLFFVGAVWILRGSTEAQNVAAILVGLIGGIIGYYFGSRGAEHAALAANLAESSKAGLKETAEETVDELVARAKAAEERLLAVQGKLVTLNRVFKEASKDDAVRTKLKEAHEKLEATP